MFVKPSMGAFQKVAKTHQKHREGREIRIDQAGLASRGIIATAQRHHPVAHLSNSRSEIFSQQLVGGDREAEIF